MLGLVNTYSSHVEFHLLDWDEIRIERGAQVRKKKVARG